MKMPSWWYKPITWRDSIIGSFIGSLVGFILWIGMVLYENHKYEIQDTFLSMKGKVMGLFKK